MSSIKRMLEKLDALFSDESKWTQRYHAQDVTGAGVPACDPYATRWCLIGGMQVTHTFSGEMFDHIGAAVTEGFLGRWNDAPERTFADVKALIRERINAAPRKYRVKIGTRVIEEYEDKSKALLASHKIRGSRVVRVNL